MRLCALPLAALVALILVACGGDHRPKVVKARRLPGSLVVADGHTVYFDCEGKESPTVVFLNGLGVDSESWTSVFDATRQFTRACTYDRFGTGLSALHGVLPNRARDARDQARELDQLLRNGRIDPPYVLVGHSWGGSLAQLYAGTHDDVAGVVLVDSSSPGQIEAITAALPPKRAGEPQVVTALRKGPTNPLASPEHLALRKAFEEVAAVRSLGSRPLIVVTAGNNDLADVPALTRVWRRLQDRLASLSSRSVHVLAVLSGHFVQADQPKLVTAAVRAAVDAARDDGRLPSCAAIFRHVQYRNCLG